MTSTESLTISDVKTIISKIISNWKNPPKITVFNGFSDPLIPPLVQLIQFKHSKLSGPKGFFYDDTVFVNAAKTDNVQDITETILHESVGHYGLRKTFGSNLKNELKDVSRLYPKDVDKKIIEYEIKNVELTKLEAAEEVLAELAQNAPELNIIDRVTSSIRNWIRRVVPGMQDIEMTKNDLIVKYIIPAKKFVQNKHQETVLEKIKSKFFDKAENKTEILRYRLNEKFNETIIDRDANFKKWSNDLPIANEFQSYEGGPAVFEVYHGTTHANINIFKDTGNSDGFLGKGPYFTTSPKDASENYACVGTDLKVRIETEVDAIFATDDSYNQKDLLEDYFDAHPEITPPSKWDEDLDDLNDVWDAHGSDAALHSATNSLVGDSDGFVMKTFVKLSNPFDASNTGKSKDLTYQSILDENGDVLDEKGTLIEWILVAKSVADSYGVNIDSYIDALLDDHDDMPLDEVFHLGLKHLGDVYDDNGEKISPGGFFREIAKEAGFDGIIMDADLHFGSGRRGFGGVKVTIMNGVENGTLHVVPFSSNQIKSAIGNNGEFDSENSDIRFRMTGN